MLAGLGGTLIHIVLTAVTRIAGRTLEWGKKGIHSGLGDTDMPRHTCGHGTPAQKDIDIQYAANIEGSLTHYRETHCPCNFFLNLN